VPFRHPSDRFPSCAPRCPYSDLTNSHRRLLAKHQRLTTQCSILSFRGTLHLPWRRGTSSRGHSSGSSAFRPPMSCALHRLRPRRCCRLLGRVAVGAQVPVVIEIASLYGARRLADRPFWGCLVQGSWNSEGVLSYAKACRYGDVDGRVLVRCTNVASSNFRLNCAL